MLIRTAIVGDIPKLISLARESPTAAHWSEAQYASALHDGHPRRVLLVAEDGGNLLGFVAGAEIAGEWELENIVVAEEARRRRLGETLLRAFLGAAVEGAGHSVFLEVRESNRSARNLYEKNGFVQSGRRPDYYRDPSEDAILYKKNLVESAPEND